VRGGIARAVKQLATERSPHTLIVDVAGVELLLSQVHALAEVCEPGVNVVAIGTDNDVGIYRDLRQLGVTDYLVKPLNAQLLGRAINLRQTPAQATPISQKLGKLIAVFGARGGVGTSTIAVNLAWHLANRHGRRVGLVDFDLQSGDCSLMLHVKATSGLSEALQNPARLDSLFLERAMAIHGERLFVLNSEESLRDDLRFEPDAAEALIHTLRQQYHYVIADVPRIYGEAYRRVMDLAMVRVIVADQTFHSVRDAVRLKNMLREGSTNHATLLVVNRGGEGGRKSLTLNDMREAAGLEPSCVIPYLPTHFAAASTAGELPVMRGGRFGAAIETLAQEISGKTSGATPDLPGEGRGWRFWRRNT